jgi:hypothetical protein
MNPTGLLPEWCRAKIGDDGISDTTVVEIDFFAFFDFILLPDKYVKHEIPPPFNRPHALVRSIAQ